MNEQEVGCAKGHADADATCAEGGERFEGWHELEGNALRAVTREAGGCKRRS